MDCTTTIQFISKCDSQLSNITPILKRFSHTEWKSGFYVGLYSTVCYCLEWKSRSSASLGAVEPHFSADSDGYYALCSQCMLSVLTVPFVLTTSMNTFTVHDLIEIPVNSIYESQNYYL